MWPAGRVFETHALENENPAHLLHELEPNLREENQLKVYYTFSGSPDHTISSSSLLCPGITGSFLSLAHQTRPSPLPSSRITTYSLSKIYSSNEI